MCKSKRKQTRQRSYRKFDGSAFVAQTKRKRKQTDIVAWHKSPAKLLWALRKSPDHPIYIMVKDPVKKAKKYQAVVMHKSIAYPMPKPRDDGSVPEYVWCYHDIHTCNDGKDDVDFGLEDLTEWAYDCEVSYERRVLGVKKNELWWPVQKARRMARVADGDSCAYYDEGEAKCLFCDTGDTNEGDESVWLVCENHDTCRNAVHCACDASFMAQHLSPQGLRAFLAGGLTPSETRELVEEMPAWYCPTCTQGSAENQHTAASPVPVVECVLHWSPTDGGGFKWFTKFVNGTLPEYIFEADLLKYPGGRVAIETYAQSGKRMPHSQVSLAIPSMPPPPAPCAPQPCFELPTRFPPTDAEIDEFDVRTQTALLSWTGREDEVARRQSERIRDSLRRRNSKVAEAKVVALRVAVPHIVNMFKDNATTTQVWAKIDDFFDKMSKIDYMSGYGGLSDYYEPKQNGEVGYVPCGGNTREAQMDHAFAKYCSPFNHPRFYLVMPGALNNWAGANTPAFRRVIGLDRHVMQAMANDIHRIWQIMKEERMFQIIYRGLGDLPVLNRP